MDGHLTNNGVVIEVWSTMQRPRLAGDGCGCEREVRWKGLGEENVVKLCEKHGREPGIIQYMLP